MVVGAIATIFSGVMALGGFTTYIAEEMQSEVTDESKKTILSGMFSFLAKKK